MTPHQHDRPARPVRPARPAGHPRRLVRAVLAALVTAAAVLALAPGAGAADARPLLQGGEPVYASDGSRCLAGLNARSSTDHFVLTAGHCASGFPTWFADASLTTLIGPTEAAYFPGSDYAVIRYANDDLPHPPTVICGGQVIEITGVGQPYVGQPVTFAGASGCHTGTVTGVNVTVGYPDGSVTNLIETNVCAEPGDSGGLLFSGSLALGLLSGSSGNCTSGGTSYFQPVAPVLAAHGLTIG